MNDDLNNHVHEKQGQMVVSVSVMKGLAAALEGGRDHYQATSLDLE